MNTATEYTITAEPMMHRYLIKKGFEIVGFEHHAAYKCEYADFHVYEPYTKRCFLDSYLEASNQEYRYGEVECYLENCEGTAVGGLLGYDIEYLYNEVSVFYYNYQKDFLKTEKAYDPFGHLIDIWGQKLSEDEIDYISHLSTVGRNRIAKTANQQTYLMLDEKSGYIKIGKSRNPRFRETTLQSESPLIKILHVIPEDVEAILHNKFKKNRVRGEWFNLSVENIKHIINAYK